MLTKEELEFIEENKKKNNLYISPKGIRGGAQVASDCDSYLLYKNMDVLTTEFANDVIRELIYSAEKNNKEMSQNLSLHVIFCGDFNELPDDIFPFEDFIAKYRDKLIIEYKYVSSVEECEFFVGFLQTERINHYSYMYLNLEKLLEEFEKQGITYSVDIHRNDRIRSAYRDDLETNLVIRYCPKKEIEGYQYKINKK